MPENCYDIYAGFDPADLSKPVIIGTFSLEDAQRVIELYKSDGFQILKVDIYPCLPNPLSAGASSRT